MQNKWINDLVTNHSPAPLPEQEQMWALNDRDMESSSKINLRDVLWKMSIKNVCQLGVLVTTRLSKKKCISLIAGGRSFHIACKHD
jgi:hypothetical protein